MRLIKTLALAALLALIGCGTQAAAVLWTGAEDLDFTTTGTSSLDQTAGRFRSGWARGALKVPGDGTNSSSYVATNKFSGASIWFTARIWMSGGANGGSGEDMLEFDDASGIARILLEYTGGGGGGQYSPGGFTVYKIDAALSKTQLGSTLSCGFANAPSAPQHLDVQVSSYGASGTITIWLDDTQCYTFTGNIKTDSNTTLNGVTLRAPNGNSGSVFNEWSEIIVTDTFDTRSMGLATLAPAGNGNANAWTCNGASDWQSVNVWANTDATNCVSGTATQIEEFTVGSLPSGQFSIPALVTSVRANNSVSGPQNIQHMVRTGAADFSSANKTQSGSLQNSQNVWTVNPNTTVPWTTSDVGAVGFNIGVNSQN